MTDIKKTKRISPGRKINQVRDGAWRVFLRDGFAGASVDDIARAANVSKATLYAYFPDKRLMFEEVLRAELDRPGNRPLDMIDYDLPADEALPRLTAEIAAWLVSQHEAQILRLIMGEAERFPDIAAAYHDSLDNLIAQPLRERLDVFVARGELDIDDTALAAEQLIRLCGANTFDRVLLRLEQPDTQAIRRTSDSAAQLFLQAHGGADRDSVPAQSQRRQPKSGTAGA